jgi:6-phosphogluconate dehydrogenase (decarboxylating)
MDVFIKSGKVFSISGIVKLRGQEVEEAISAEVLTAALFVRFRSRQENTFAEKILSAMRNKFGGHVDIYPGN